MRGMYFLQVLWDNTLHVFNNSINKICKQWQASDKARAYSTSFNINTQSGIRYLNFQSSLFKDITCPNLFPRFPFFSILIRIVCLRPSWILHMCIGSSSLPVSKKKKKKNNQPFFSLSFCHVALNSPFPCAFSYSANHDKAFLILKMIPYPTYVVIISFLSMSCQI